MIVTLYNNASDDIALDKTLTQIAQAEGVLHNKKNSMDMTIRLPGDQYNNVVAANYVYLDTYGRYYFRDSFDIENNTVTVNLREDVLSTFKAGIRANNCTVLRNASLSNAYMLDDKYRVLGYRNIVTKEFPSGFENDTIILMTVG